MTRELTRHFIARLFDSELVATPGEWIRVAVPGFSMALTAAILMQPMYRQKYALGREEYREALSAPGRLLAEVRFDEQSIASFLMIVTAIFASIFWQSFYPTLRDALALASLPIRPRQIFLAKLSAITLLFSVYTLALVLPASAIFSSITSPLIPGPHFAATAAAWTGASAFVYFAALAAQGLLLNLLPPALFNRLSVWLQALLFAAGLGAIPLFSRLPAHSGPASWFAALWAALAGRPDGDATPALVALATAAGLALACYALAYHRYHALLLEVPVKPDSERGRLREAIVTRLTPDPREQAMLAFIVQGLLRSRTHQFVLLALAALAISFNLRAVSATADPTRELQYTVVFGPLAMSIVALAGFRYLFSLPTELRANWLFRITEGESRASWLRAVERFVLLAGVGASFLCWLPAAIWSLGVGALIAYAPAVLFVLWLFERLFGEWRKAPFTCSYLPGKQPWKMLLVLFYAVSAISTAAAAFLSGVFFPPMFFLVTPALTVLWYRARRRRLAAWTARPLLFEELAPAAVEPLDLENGPRHVDATAARAAAEAPDLAELWLAGADGESRGARVLRWLREAPRDILLAFRAFRLRPLFTFGAVLTIALGLGLNAAFFAIYDAFYLRQSAVRDPGTLYDYSELLRHSPRRGAAVEPYLPTPRLLPALRAKNEIIAEAAGRYDLLIRHGDRMLVGLAVTGNYFAMLGARAAQGRLFGEGEEEPEIVLSHRAWRGRFGADRQIIGRRLEIRRIPYRIAGVAVESFHGVATDGEPDFWIPLATWPRIESGQREPDHLAILLRLRPHLTAEQAKRSIRSIAQEHRPDRPIWDLELRPAATLVSSLSDFTSLIFLTFAFTLAIPCANVANLMLARGLERQREFGVRMALGSSRGRLARQLLTEAVILALAGGALGFAAARAALDFALRTLHSSLPWVAHLRAARLPDMAVDQRVFLYLLAVAVVTAVVFAVWPALESSRWGAVYALRRELGGLRDFHLRDALVAGQVAVCVMMLASAALLLRGTLRFTRVNPGFDPADLHAVATLDWRVSPLVERTLREQPWLAGVARASHMPTQLREVLVRAPANSREFRIPYNSVSADYLDVLGVRVVEGRGFLAHEAEAKAKVAVISHAAAQLLWPGGRSSAIGKVVRPDTLSVRGLPPREGEYVVVGVTRESAEKEGVLAGAPRLYFPDAQGRIALARGRSGRTAETSGRIERLLSTVRSDTGLEVTFSIEEMLRLENYVARAGLWVSAVLAAVALILTATGVYGVMSFLAGQRRREIGIRVALGATGGMVMSLIVRHAASLIGAGLLAGLVLALWSAKLIAARTMYVAVWDASGYLAGLIVVGVVALAASIPPAWRAAREDVLATLRLE